MSEVEKRSVNILLIERSRDDAVVRCSVPVRCPPRLHSVYILLVERSRDECSRDDAVVRGSVPVRCPPRLRSVYRLLIERSRDERSRDALGVWHIFRCIQSPQYTPLYHHSKRSQKSTMQTSPIKPVFWQLLFYSSFVSLSPICQFSIFHMILGIIVIP